MNDRILDEVKYSQDVRKYYKSILEGRFLSINTETMNDDELLHSLPYGLTDSDRSLCFANNLCTWFTIGESRELEFVRPYKQMCLSYGEESSIYINYSRFWLPLKFKNHNNTYFGNQSGVNKIDGILVDPEYFFANHFGEKIFYICGKKGVDQFGRKQNCLMFAFNNVNPTYIRKYIINSQLYTLQEVINNPIEYHILPEATIVFEWNGQTKKNYRIVGHPVIYELVNRIYTEEFSESFNSKYRDILSRNEHILNSENR